MALSYGGGENVNDVAEEGRIELQGIQVELRPVPRATARAEELWQIPKPGGGREALKGPGVQVAVEAQELGQSTQELAL